MSISGDAPIKYSNNSIDLIRIIAATQVVLFHFLSHMPGLSNIELIKNILSFFPGVPVFFFISGFLITGSWQRDPNICRYMISRVTRIFPALYLAIIFSLSIILFTYNEPARNHILTLFIWLAAQLCLLTSWNPDFLRSYGIGVVNASLWTIPVEFIFYGAAILISLLGARLRAINTVLVSVLILSLSISILIHCVPTDKIPHGQSIYKLLTVSPASFVTWIWMFIVGALSCVWFDKIIKLLRDNIIGSVFAFLSITAISYFIRIPGLLNPYGNDVGFLNMISMAALVLSVAYRFPNVGRKLFKGNDFSYGLYLFHMPLLNLVIMLGLAGWMGFIVALAGSVAMAVISWFLVEQPMLRLGKSWKSRIV
ncbi:acyltransferase family protein [Asticcacaulis benevestitus]|uniref:acyltransferase family protein n=1 Tax=Asticcacaulis benevestitus TaxID=347481 RepID=UPI0003A836F8|nr:acyltransferase [Asticcacaulis benevestitus]